jgi:hypothetical protein
MPSHRILSVDHVLNAIAAVFLILLIHRAFVDIDLRNFDSLAYHLPFAGRLWGIVPRDELLFVDHLEDVYNGFPLLGELLQGLLWYFFGLMQAANLVALFSLVLFCYFASVYLAVPAGSLFLALLAVPLIQVHAAASLVDLPANVGCAAALLIVYRLYAQTVPPGLRDIVLFSVAAAAAVNTKFQAVPIVGLCLVAVGGRLVFFYSGRSGVDGPNRSMLVRIGVLAACSPVIFASLIKNAIAFGNPFYPVAFGIFGWSLPHTMSPAVVSPLYLKDAPQSLRWLLSVFEFRAFDPRRPILWMGDQGYLPAGVPADRMGGYFFVYVILSLLLFAMLVARNRTRPRRVAAVFFVLLSVITSALPQSHELRYYMYWIVVLITLNFYLLVRAREEKGRGFSASHLGIISCAMLITTVVLTKALYIRPTTQAIVIGITESLEPAIKAAVEKKPDICVLGSTNLFLLYTTDFHPSLRYSVKAAYEQKQCGSRPVLHIP